MMWHLMQLPCNIVYWRKVLKRNSNIYVFFLNTFKRSFKLRNQKICYFWFTLIVLYKEKNWKLLTRWPKKKKSKWNKIFHRTSLKRRLPQTDASWLRRPAADPAGLPEGGVCARRPRLHRLQRRGRVPLQGQRLLVQLRDQVPRVQLSLHGHPGHGGESAEDHRDLGRPLQRVWGVR